MGPKPCRHTCPSVSPRLLCAPALLTRSIHQRRKGSGRCLLRPKRVKNAGYAPPPRRKPGQSLLAHTEVLATHKPTHKPTHTHSKESQPGVRGNPPLSSLSRH